MHELLKDYLENGHYNKYENVNIRGCEESGHLMNIWFSEGKSDYVNTHQLSMWDLLEFIYNKNK